MAERVFVVGVGMTDFVEPSSRPDGDYPDMVREAGTQALDDAGVTYADVQHVAAGHCFGDTTAGQRAVYELGYTGVPVVNVNNVCATGSTALMVARNAVAAGMADCALAIGFEKMGKVNFYTDRAYPLDKHLASMATRHGSSDALITAQMFGNAGREHIERYGTKPESFARVAVKNHKHSVHNPRAQFRKDFTDRLTVDRGNRRVVSEESFALAPGDIVGSGLLFGAGLAVSGLSLQKGERIVMRTSENGAFDKLSPKRAFVAPTCLSGSRAT